MAARSPGRRPESWGERRLIVESNFVTEQLLPVSVRPVDEYDVIVPDDQFLLVSARLLSPERHDPLLVADEDGPGLGELPALTGGQTLADLVDVLLAVAGGVAALAGGGDGAGQAGLTSSHAPQALGHLLTGDTGHGLGTSVNSNQ